MVQLPPATLVTDSVVTAIVGRAAPAGSPPAAGSVLAAGYGSDEEEVGPASIQGSAATAAEQRDSGSQSANGLPSGFFEVCFFEAFFEDLSTVAGRVLGNRNDVRGFQVNTELLPTTSTKSPCSVSFVPCSFWLQSMPTLKSSACLCRHPCPQYLPAYSTHTCKRYKGQQATRILANWQRLALRELDATYPTMYLGWCGVGGHRGPPSAAALRRLLISSAAVQVYHMKGCKGDLYS